ncbi:hypothetical protein QJS04_geneDACA017944 [Acorus gramineus]|uniref:Uncharacterized protein n=1 Tax=Acorus gramineus TaxID=55184 RepID=A0AAV9A6X3_ACOGR|nr:hypothetical protein QJS04_geneDACA017944 [Acorus gramineus]
MADMEKENVNLMERNKEKDSQILEWREEWKKVVSTIESTSDKNKMLEAKIWDIKRKCQELKEQIILNDGKIREREEANIGLQKQK